MRAVGRLDRRPRRQNEPSWQNKPKQNEAEQNEAERRQNKAMDGKPNDFSKSLSAQREPGAKSVQWQNKAMGGKTSDFNEPDARAQAPPQIPATKRAMITMVSTCMVPWQATAKKNARIMRPIFSPSGLTLRSSRQTRRLVGNR